MGTLGSFFLLINLIQIFIQRVKKEKKKGTYSVWSFSFHRMLYYLDPFSNQRVKKEGLNLCMVFQFSYNVVGLIQRCRSEHLFGKLMGVQLSPNDPRHCYHSYPEDRRQNLIHGIHLSASKTPTNSSP